MAINLTYPEGAALIAGGGGRVGSGVTRRLAEAGIPVVFTFKENTERANAMAADLRGEGLRVWAQPMDMTDPASIDAALDFAEAMGGTLRTVACTAGALVPFNNLADFDIPTVENFFNQDGMAYYRLVNRVVPRLRRHGGGSITLSTTIALFRTIVFDGISPFSKGAVDALMRQIAWEEAQHGIRCNAVPISVIVRPPVAGEAWDAGPANPVEQERIDALINQISGLMRIPGPYSPESVGDLFAFLASEQARYITGQSISMDGGMTL